jgi:hypothetical protein
MTKDQTTNGKFLLIAYIFFVLLLLLSPFWLWALKPSKPLDVLIVDKTVPNPNYREHKGLIWILNHEKYRQTSRKRYDFRQDYYGFVLKAGKQFSVKELPKNLRDYEVIYLADQYGVYEEEFTGENPLGERSKHLYGGLQMDELTRIENELLNGNGKTLIAEFNTFASPTTDEVREKISNLLNLKWSGWIGRYFPDLSGPEVPIWIKEHYEGKWNFAGAGIVLVNQSNFIYVIEEKHLTAKGVPLQFTDLGRNLFSRSMESSYHYWFDITEAHNEEEVLAHFRLPVKKKVRQELLELGIPTTFPAIQLHRNVKYTSYYFSGDFADEPEVPDIYQTRGMEVWKRYTSRSFYWKTYVPMMKQILREGLHRNVDQVVVELEKSNGLTINSQTGTRYLQIRKNGKWENLLVKGVNMGIAKPGTFPGETAITKEEYFRWFKAIGAMNANALRVYTIHPPHFYEALYEYNQIAKTPLFLFHGVWVNEEQLVASQNAFSSEIVADFQSEIRNTIDIIHGNAQLPERAGHASGNYTANISPFVLGFIIGIEWDPYVVQNTNVKNKEVGQWKGKYFQTKLASPFEVWLARMMDFAANYETENYSWQHSMSFTNWVTTDLLKHPAEPSENEDLVTVNPNHIFRTEDFLTGLFASYHVYPYYPDFLNYEQKYLKYVDRLGESNNYAGYLNDLIASHTLPVLVAEFGVPSSRGLTHLNAYGMNQGFHSEQAQGEINRRLFRSVVDEGYAGGLVFTWQDEWFKRTWNTMDLDNPNRRPFWSNVQTNEQHFGLLTFEPSKPDERILVDGFTGDWGKITPQASYSGGSHLKQVDLYSDASYVYFKIMLASPIDWRKDDLFILLDTVPDQGQTKFQLHGGWTVAPGRGVDFLVNLVNEKNSSVLVDSYYDPFYYQYGEQLRMIEQASYVKRKNNGRFHPIRLALNKRLIIPATGKEYPFQAYETGKLLFGNGNPNAKNEFNSLTDVAVSPDKGVIELRLAWQLLNMKDPSMKEAMGDIWQGGLGSSKKVDHFKIRVIVSAEQEGGLEDSGFFRFEWPEWEKPRWEERLKRSYFMMKDAYQQIGGE